MIIALLLVAAPVQIASKDALLDFSYSWSAEAAAVPALDRRFRADAAKARIEALRVAEEDRSARRGISPAPVPWNEHLFERAWETAGQTERLLSLAGGTATFTGGAHPNSGSMALLWDRKLSRELNIPALLRPGRSWAGAIRGPFCILLDRERAKFREEKIVRGAWPNQCPELDDLTLTLADRNGNGQFDHVDVTADAYVAGPYVEAAYEISLPLTAAMISRLKPEYRRSFEPQPPVQ